MTFALNKKPRKKYPRRVLSLSDKQALAARHRYYRKVNPWSVKRLMDIHDLSRRTILYAVHQDGPYKHLKGRS